MGLHDVPWPTFKCSNEGAGNQIRVFLFEEESLYNRARSCDLPSPSIQERPSSSFLHQKKQRWIQMIKKTLPLLRLSPMESNNACNSHRKKKKWRRKVESTSLFMLCTVYINSYYKPLLCTSSIMKRSTRRSWAPWRHRGAAFDSQRVSGIGPGRASAYIRNQVFPIPPLS